MPVEEVTSLLKAILNALLDDSTRPVMRYKLAQLCSAVHTFGFPHCELVFQEYADAIEALPGNLNQSESLSKPTAELLRSLTTVPVTAPKIGSPERGRRLSHGAIRLLGRAVPIAVMSRTPEPHVTPLLED
jgi:hypothetical protein